MQIMSSNAVALQLLGASSNQPGLQSKPNAAEMYSQAATRYVEAAPELTGVYTDPRAEASSQSQPSLSQRAIDALQRTLSTEGREFQEQAKARLENALGRSLGENETFRDLDSYTRSELPKDVLDMNRSADYMALTMNMAMSRAKEINLDRSYSLKFTEGMQKLDKSLDLQGLDMSKAEGRRAVVDFAIKLQTQINSAGIQLSENNEVASEMMSKSLEAAGVDSLADLKNSYAELHWSRFEIGEFKVIFKGVEITKETL